MIDSNLYTWSGGDQWGDPSDWRGGDNPNPDTHIPSRVPSAGNEVEFDGAATIDDSGAATWFFDYAAVTFASGASLDMTNSGETSGQIGINGGSLIFDGSNFDAVGTSVQISSGGSLIVEGGGSVTIAARPGYSDFEEDSGSVTVTGRGSSLDINVDQQLTFGGLVSVLYGATMTTGGDVEPQFDGSEVEISGAGSKLTIANASVIFGGNGAQSMLVEQGAALDAKVVLIGGGVDAEVEGASSSFHASAVSVSGSGSANDASARLVIDGAGATAVISGAATVESYATLKVSGGARAKIGGNLELTPGAGSGGGSEPAAILTITGKSATLSVTAALDAGGGKDSEADITISDGGSLTVSGDMTLGADSGGACLLTLADVGSSLTVNGNLVIGVDGSASLTVDDHASFTVKGEIVIGDEQAAPGVGAAADTGHGANAATYVVKDVLKLDTPGGKPTTLREDCIVGDNEYGELDILSGYKINANQKTITVGDQSLGYGVVTVSDASSTLSNFGSLILANEGRGYLDVAKGGLVSGDYLRAGGGAANAVAEIDVSNAHLKLKHLVLGAARGKASSDRGGRRRRPHSGRFHQIVERKLRS